MSLAMSLNSLRPPMATSTCVKCGQSRFELHEASPGKAEFKFWYLQCTSCGGVAGLTEFFNAGAILKRMEDELKRVRAEVHDIKGTVDTIKSRQK